MSGAREHLAPSATADLAHAGVSIWLDDLSRHLLQSGGLAALIAEHHVTGVTTNPSILAAALSDASTYADDLRACAAASLSAEATVFELACRDVREACDLLAPVHQQSSGTDGWVSLEVSPRLAHDAEATIRQAVELWHAIARPNVMIKVPATDAGLVAIPELVGRGISVNATLIFSLTRVRQVLNAYLSGLELAREAGIDLRTVHAVASVFVSRFDTLIDPQLDALGSAEAETLRSRAGVANAALSLEIVHETFESARAQLLLASGANRMRPLWASTGVKDARLSAAHYVDVLVAAGSVNTMPPATLRAVAAGPAAHQPVTEERLREAEQQWNALDALGISYADVTQQLEREGLEKFADAWEHLVAEVDSARNAVPA